jgi:uncharacterized RDD family membrane protein YckC
VRRFSFHGHPQHLALEGAPLATFGARAGAFFLDLLVVALAVTAFGLPAAIRAARANPGHGVVVPFEPFHSLWGLAAMVAYFGSTTYFGRGRTLGKRLFRIRVVSLVRDELTLWQCLERALGYGASALEGGFGFLQYFLQVNRQTVHDRIAETIVVAASAPDVRAAQH